MRRQQVARYEALAHVEHQRHCHQPPEQGPDTMYRLEMKPGRTGLRRGAGQAEQSSAAVQGSGAGQLEGGKGRQGKGARQ